MGQRGDRIRDVETRESADMIEVSGDPNTLNGGAGVNAAPGLMAINPASGLMYYNQDGEPDGWIGFGTSSPVPGGEINTGANVGTSGGEVYRDKTGVVLNFRKIDGVAPLTSYTDSDLVKILLDFDLAATVTSANDSDYVLIRQVDDTYNRISIANLLTGEGEANTGANVGTGSQVYQGMSGTILQFRTLLGTLPIVAIQNANDVTFSFDINALTAVSPLDGTEELVVEQTGVIGKTTFDDLMTEAGGVLGAATVGAGTAVYKDRTGATLNFRSITVNTPITVAVIGGNEIDLDIDINTLTTSPAPDSGDYLLIRNADGTNHKLDYTTLPQGTITGGTNLGTGVGIYNGVNATDLEFLSLLEGEGVSIVLSGSTEEYTFSLDINGITLSGTPAGTDLIAYYDGAAIRKGTVANLLSGYVTGASNLGAGANVFESESSGVLQFRSVVGSNPIAVTQNASDITLSLDIDSLTTDPGPEGVDWLIIEADVADTVYKIDWNTLVPIIDVSSVGTGTSFIKQITSRDVELYTLAVTTPFTKSVISDTVTLGMSIISLDDDPTPGTGSYFIVHDGSSFYKIDYATLPGAGSITGASNLGTGANVFESEVADVLRFRSLIATNGISATQNANDITFSLDVDSLTTHPSPDVADWLIIEDDVTDTVYKINWTTLVPVTDVVNTGIGVGIRKTLIDREITLLSLVGREGVSAALAATTNEIDIELDIDGIVLSGTPSGTDLIAYYDGLDTRKGTIANLLSGYVTGASNLGTGANVFESEVTGVLQFRSILGASGIVATQNANDVTLSLDIDSLTTHPSLAGADWLIVEDEATDVVYKIDWNTLVPIVSVSNIGTGSDIYSTISSRSIELRTLIGTTPVAIAQNANDLTLSLTLAGLVEMTSPVGADSLLIEENVSGNWKWIDRDTLLSGYVSGATNLGGGSNVFSAEVAGELQFRSIVDTPPVDIVQSATELTLSLDILGLAADPAPGSGHFLLVQTATTYYKIDYSSLPDGTITGASNLGTGADVFSSEVTGTLQFRSIIGTNPIAVTENVNDITLSLDVDSLLTAPAPVSGDWLILEADVANTVYKIDWNTLVPIVDVSSVGTGTSFIKQITSRDVELYTLAVTLPLTKSIISDTVTLGMSIISLDDDPTPGTGSYFMVHDGSGFYKIDYANLPGASSITGASNLGTGANVFESEVTGVLRFRSLIGSTGILATQNANDITFELDINGITLSGTPDTVDLLPYYDVDASTVKKTTVANLLSGVITGASNLGSGIGVYSGTSLGELELLSIDGGEGISTILSSSTEEIAVALDINGITLSGTPSSSHLIAYYDGVSTRKSTIANLASGHSHSAPSTTVVHKVVWLSGLQRIDLTNASNGYVSLTAKGVPSTATGAYIRFVYLSQASGVHSYAAIGSGKESNTHQLVLYGYVTNANDGTGERDAYGLVELDGSGRVYYQRVGTWNVRIEIYGYVAPVTVYRP